MCSPHRTHAFLAEHHLNNEAGELVTDVVSSWEAHLILAASAGPAPRDLLVFRHNSSLTRKFR